MKRIVTVSLSTAIDRLLNVEGFRIGAHQPGHLVARVPAGKGVNVSRTLSALRVENIATGFVGRDELGLFEQSFEGSTTRPQFLTVEGQTRENITLIDPTTGIETHIRDVAPSPSPGDLERLRNKIGLLAEPEGLIILSGSLPPGVEVGYVVELVDLAVAKGARVAVDVPGDVLRALRDRRLWLAKPNTEELATMLTLETISDEQIVSTGRELADDIHIVIITCGAAGGYLFTDDTARMGQVDFGEQRVGSTVGSGDSLLAAFVAATLRGDDTTDAYRFALAVATATVVHEAPAQFEMVAAETFLERTSVTPVA